MRYTYKDFETGKVRWTRAPFTGWTQPTGLLNVRYAVFARRADSILVPEYLLTAETKQAINASESAT